MVRRGIGTARTRIPYTVYDVVFSNSCYVDAAVIDQTRAGIMRAAFTNDEGEEVVVHVATEQFFILHTLRAEDMTIWESMNLNGFFGLAPWGPDYMRAYQALSTLTPANDVTIIDLQGQLRTFRISADLIRHALGLAIGESLDYDRKKHTDAENDICSANPRPTWNDLNRQRIRLPLQLHMQHFHMTYPHRFSTPEKLIAVEYSLRDYRGEGVKLDFSKFFLSELQRGTKSIREAKRSMAKRPHPIYLGGVLVLTRIIYYAMNVMNELPAAIQMPEDARPRHTTRPDLVGKKSKKKKSTKERKPSPTGETSRISTRGKSRQAEARKSPSPPKSSSSSETESEHELDRFDNELEAAMKMSMEADPKKGDMQEQDDLMEAIKRSLQEEANKKSDKEGKDRQKPYEYAGNKEEELNLMKSILHSLNQDETAVRRIAKAVQQHERKKQQVQEEKERKEMEELEALKKKRREEEEASRSDKGKKAMDPPPPSPKHPSPPPQSQSPLRDTTQHSPIEKTHRETDAPTTAGASTAEEPGRRGDFRSNEEVIASLRRQLARQDEDYKFNRDLIDEQRKELDEKDALIIELTKAGLESSTSESVEVLKKGMLKVREENKLLQEKCAKISEAYQDFVLSDREKPWVQENKKLQAMLDTLHEKNLKAEEAYKTAMELYKSSKSTNPASATATIEEHQAMLKKMEDLEARNKSLSDRLSRASNEAATSEIPWARTSVDLHWDEGGELDDMSEDELPYVKADWKFQKEHFKSITPQARRLSHYEAVVRKLGRYLFPDETDKMYMQEMSAPLIQMKTKARWEEWEANNPEMLRAGYNADPAHLYSEAIMKDQLPWRKEWFKLHPETIKMYAESPRNLRIDPSYCPCERRYRWREYERLVERQPFLLNWPRIRGPDAEDALTEQWMAKQAKYFIKYFEQVPDYTCQFFVKILRMIYVCLTGFEDAKKVDRMFWKFNMGTRELTWDFDIGPTPQQVHGLWARVRMLPSHYAQTFEEMIQYGFIEGWTSSCFAPTANPIQRFLAHQLEDVRMPLTRGPIPFEDVQRAHHIIEMLEEVRPHHSLHQSREQVTLPEGFVVSAEAMMRMLRRVGLLGLDEVHKETPVINPRKRDGDDKDKGPQDKGASSSKRRRRK